MLTYNKMSVLGSTGSIGTQALRVAEALGIEVKALAAGRNIKLLEEQIRRFSPEVACVYDEQAAAELKSRVRDTGTKILAGQEGVCEVAAHYNAELTLNAIVGIMGLRPTVAALESGKALALANKETLVAGGRLITDLAKSKNLPILPVDSEHSAMFQCLQGRPPEGEYDIILTASGGPFFGKTREKLTAVTPKQAMKHPNWEMGAKISIDSATLMNKGLEVIEAVRLFDVPADRIKVVVHRQSIVHSAVEYADGSVVAQMGVPDMCIPIQYAITYPKRMPCPAPKLDLTAIGALTFDSPDMDTFVCLRAAFEALAAGGLAPAALNGANEQAVELFLHGKIGFLDIGEFVLAAAERAGTKDGYTIDDILAADRDARGFVLDNAD